MRKAAALILAAVGGGVLVPGCAGSEPVRPWSIDEAEVVFTARRDGRSDVYVLRLGGEPFPLTRGDTSGNFGRPSPDGAWFAFQGRTEAGTTDIFLVRADATGLRNLTADPAWDVLPSWSPDGRQLAFMSTRGFTLGDGGPFPGHLYLVNADGSGLRQLTREPLTSSLGPQDWTPDGRHLLLSREVDGQLDLFLLDVDTGEEQRLTTDPSREYGAAVSPDGTMVALHAETDDASQIVVMDADGTNRRLITSGRPRGYGPRWSPDGRWLVFSQEGENGEQYDVVAVELATSRARVLIATPEDEREPDFMPVSRPRQPDL